MLVYASLFLTAFLAATVLPLSSELLFITLLSQEHSAAALIFWATLGNTLGACVNWWLGTLLRHNASSARARRWTSRLRLTEKELTRAAEWFARYGKWSLLFAWAPIVGDALTVIAGLARVPLWQLALLAGAGKLARYLSLAGLLAALIS